MKLIPALNIGDAELASSSIAEADYAAWAAGTTYVLGDRVIVVATHRIYESLAAANIGHSPATESAWWVDVGPTNRWAMFDASSVSSSASGSIAVTLTLPACGAVALVGISAASVQLSATGVSITRAVPAPTAPDTAVMMVIDDIGFAGGALTITVTGPGTVIVQNMIFGTAFDIGEAQYGMTIGITDYSTKTVDEFGNISVTRRGYNRRISGRVAIPNDRVDVVAAMLAGVRATMCVWQAHPAHDSLTLFGFYTDWQFDITYPTLTMCSITVEGLPSAGAGGAISSGSASVSGAGLQVVGTPSRGDIIYRSEADWRLLNAGVAGQVLITGGPGADPTWGPPGGSDFVLTQVFS
jgi:hypothetical protein